MISPMMLRDKEKGFVRWVPILKSEIEELVVSPGASAIVVRVLRKGYGFGLPLLFLFFAFSGFLSTFGGLVCAGGCCF